MTMSSRLACRAAAAICLLATSRPVHAQHTTPAQQPASAQRSTLSGVYTAEQAERGSEVYAMQCRSCHTPASHTGEVFEKFWKGKTLADLLTFVSERMPKNDPGGLDANQYADVVAYLLKMNALPVGPAELPPDPSALTSIPLELPPPAKKPASSTKRIPVVKPNSAR